MSVYASSILLLPSMPSSTATIINLNVFLPNVPYHLRRVSSSYLTLATLSIPALLCVSPGL